MSNLCHPVSGCCVGSGGGVVAVRCCVALVAAVGCELVACASDLLLVAVGSAAVLACVVGAVCSAAALPCSVAACCVAVLVVVLAAVLAVGVAPSFGSLVIGWLVNPFANIVF